MKMFVVLPLSHERLVGGYDRRVLFLPAAPNERLRWDLPQGLLPRSRHSNGASLFSLEGGRAVLAGFEVQCVRRSWQAGKVGSGWSGQMLEVQQRGICSVDDAQTHVHCRRIATYEWYLGKNRVTCRFLDFWIGNSGTATAFQASAQDRMARARLLVSVTSSIHICNKQTLPFNLTTTVARHPALFLSSREYLP